MQAGESARPRGKPEVSRYEPERQGGAALLTAPASYNPAADVTATAGKEEKKKARSTFERLGPRPALHQRAAGNMLKRAAGCGRLAASS